MEEEEFLNLIDSYWFSREIFKKSSNKVVINSSTTFPSEEEEKEEESLVSAEDNKYRDGLSSPSSSSSSSSKTEVPLMETEKHHLSKKKKTKKGTSKSLSELEFQELKGFMDLGFVFSEEDKDSNLVEIIPGLQRRLGKEIIVEEEQEQEQKKFRVSRPYLSEAWEVLEMRKTKKKKNPLINWRVPNPNNEIDMKDSLKCWAHNVASTVM